MLVYIAEAHADDEWPIGMDLKFNQPKTLFERHKIVKHFQETTKFTWPTLIDTLENNFDKIYCAWPLRFYLIDQSRNLAFIAEPKEGGFYDIEDIRITLNNFIRHTTETQKFSQRCLNSAEELFQLLDKKYPLAQAAVAPERDEITGQEFLEVTFLTSFKEHLSDIDVPEKYAGFEVENTFS